MGKGRPRAVEKGVLGQNTGVASTGTLNIPLGPVYYPSEEEFKDPLEYIYKIRPEAEAYGICKIVPPKSWKPPFALNLDSFTFPTKTQAIHQLQARPASCDSKTFELEYNRFLEDHCSRKLKKKVVFEGEDLDLCKLFNAVKRFGGYNKVVKEKKWGEVSRFVRSGRKISECAKHVLCQLYREHLYDYENYQYKLNKEAAKGGKRGMHEIMKSEHGVQFLSSKRRRKNGDGEKVKVSKLEEEELDQVCEQCKSGLHGEVMLLCDRCNKGWHIYCLSPPLKHIPPGNWYCLECLNSDKDSFGFVPGKQLALEAFRRVADRATRKWFGAGPASRVQIEKRFWDIVEGSAGEVEVMYGSDLDTSLYGSGFPRVDDQRPESVEVNVWDEYCCSPWNLNNLPKLEGSMLRAVHNNITGVMVPWLYVGMLFSSFCWHFEDHCFYSMNYLHWGEPKCWYSVPGSEANSFEKVMRDSLPDLFDAQPDLLFQLVTMLNPSVLQKNGVPVYTVLQEPGNFVITFPRSFHGGFNFGLNCAEAVNFAPADWLPHGGYGAKLYKQYHKSAVISHEELLCVVAKFQSHFNSRVSPHLKKELLRIYANEKTWRERLWRSGIMKSSPMSARKCPEYVGTEEDPTCIICQQYLYLSAVVCRCRPSTFVCLEHWEHLCECKPWKLRLLYRHSLAELYELVLAVDKYDSELPQEAGLQRHSSCSNQLCSLTKKVKGGRVTLSQLAEQWLLRSSKILQDGFSSVGYAALLKEAEQFLWAGREMEPVRSVAKRLTEAKKWGEDIRDCVSKIENWSYDHPDLERVHLEHVKELLSFNPVPCSEPLHLKLKDYAEEASRLAQEIDAALSNCTSMSELELLYSRAGCLPVYVKETEKLLQKISSGKVWIDSARKCISDKRPAGVELDLLYMLKSEILELQVQLPETEMILDLLRQAESCRARCTEILNGSIDPKIVKLLLQELAGFAVNVLELELLKQYQSDTALWVARCNSILVNVHEREDQQNVVDELTSLLNEGRSLRIQVDELPLVEVELKKACCREKALKARGTKMSLDFVKQLMSEAVVLQIDGEKLFVDISGVLEAAMQWEERATSILAHKAQMFEFEDLIRMSEDIFVDLPSLDLIQDAVLVGKSWLKNSKPFLVSALPMTGASSALLEVDVLKELVSQAKSLKVSFEEKILLGRVLKNCEDWEQDACSLLQNADTLLDIRNINNAMDNSFISKIESLVTRMESAKKSGLSSGCDFHEIPKLENACSKLQWCNKVLSFYSSAPSYKDVEGLMETAEHLSITSSSGLLWGSLVNGVKWLKRVLDVVSLPCNFRRCKLSDAEEVLAQSQDINISFPVMIRQLENAIREHKLWQEKVHHFFSLKFEERSWSLMLQLKECGKAAAFNCSELDMVLSEVEKVEKWKQSCINIVGMSVRDTNPLLGSLRKIKQSLGISLQIYDKSRCSKVIILCMCSDSGSANHPFLTCLTCKDCYHLECLGQAPVDKNYAEQYICPYCQVSELGSVSQKGGGPLKFEGKRPDIKSLIELLSDAENFTMGIEERNTLQEVVEQALACNACVAELVDFTSSYLDKDLSIVSRKLTIALKAIDIAGVYDHKASSDLKMALAKNSWRMRVSRLQEGSPKPTIKQIQHLLKEGLAMNIPPEDHFLQRLSELKHNGLQWAERAKKVVADSGALALDQVFELINEGENLPVYFAKELKSLEARSMLHCICRKPLDERRMIACDWCGEWYHTNCVKVPSPTKVYICAACYPHAEQLVDHERSRSTESVEPKTPSPQHTTSRKKQKRAESSLTQKMLTITNSSIILRNRIDCLWWRNRKPFRRATRKRADLDNLSPFSHIQ